MRRPRGFSYGVVKVQIILNGVEKPLKGNGGNRYIPVYTLMMTEVCKRIPGFFGQEMDVDQVAYWYDTLRADIMNDFTLLKAQVSRRG